MTRSLSEIDTIVVHCSDSPNGRPKSVETIDAWHKARGFRRSAKDMRRHQPSLGFIGYHKVILTSGVVVDGRALDENGAHATGHNGTSIGVCLVGLNAFSLAQWTALRTVVQGLTLQLGRPLKVISHASVSVDDPPKTCPGFNVEAWLAEEMAPLPGHLLQPPAAPERS